MLINQIMNEENIINKQEKHSIFEIVDATLKFVMFEASKIQVAYIYIKVQVSKDQF